MWLFTDPFPSVGDQIAVMLHNQFKQALFIVALSIFTLAKNLLTAEKITDKCIRMIYTFHFSCKY